MFAVISITPWGTVTILSSSTCTGVVPFFSFYYYFFGSVASGNLSIFSGNAGGLYHHLYFRQDFYFWGALQIFSFSMIMVVLFFIIHGINSVLGVSLILSLSSLFLGLSPKPFLRLNSSVAYSR